MDNSKIASLFILFGLSTICGFLSILLLKCLIRKFGTSSKVNLVVSWLDCFSGGVFFAATVLDLLPEAREVMENALKHYDFETEYPLTELLLCVGFFSMLFVEHLSHFLCSPRKVEKSNEANAEPQKHEDVAIEVHGKHSENTVIFESCIDSSVSQTYGAIGQPGKEKSPVWSAIPTDSFATDTKNKSSLSVAFTSDDGKNPDIRNAESTNFLSDANTSTEPRTEEGKRSKIRGAVLLIALSLHMIFDGLALGLLTETSAVWQLLGALSVHKCLVFFTIGIQSVEILSSSKKAACIVIVLALVSPLGLLIDEAINSSDDVITRDTVSAVLQGIATGTFLFVTFFEILLRELGSHNSTLLKIIFSFFGFVLMALVRLLAHED
ncbi:uncharacterized protein LOC127842034 [Dreissena polymorpha]|uniref:Uncharacterized protein n=1 Tax=Dreissena polymorpha TaxID=45954 RepID=A0A9D4EKQ3_DREPO|nr:uncharacterized protein LOC127842034 [Dreissena polymorpha]KAH3779747.1 hypothetical protein DPMN_157554 [Dreissena polymorpha]